MVRCCIQMTMDVVGGCTKWSKVEAPDVVVVGEDHLPCADIKSILPVRMEFRRRQSKLSSCLPSSSGVASSPFRAQVMSRCYWRNLTVCRSIDVYICSGDFGTRF